MTGIAPGSLVSDFSTFAAFAFGSADPNGNLTSALSEVIWSQLLAGNDRQLLINMNARIDIFNMEAGDDVGGGSIRNDRVNGGDGSDTLSSDKRTVFPALRPFGA